MSHLLLLTKSTQSSVEVLPALALLPHHVKILPAEASALLDAPPCDAVLVDGRHDLAQVRSLTRVIRTTGIECALILILTEGGLAVAASDWGMDDVILTTAGPAESADQIERVVILKDERVDVRPGETLTVTGMMREMRSVGHRVPEPTSEMSRSASGSTFALGSPSRTSPLTGNRQPSPGPSRNRTSG
jgi:hypothetical protein